MNRKATLYRYLSSLHFGIDRHHRPIDSLSTFCCDSASRKGDSCGNRPSGTQEENKMNTITPGKESPDQSISTTTITDLGQTPPLGKSHRRDFPHRIASLVVAFVSGWGFDAIDGRRGRTNLP
jgi:hypothetical protein